MIQNSLFALITTIGFGILFNIKGIKLLYCGLGGGIAWFVYLLCMHFGVGNILSMFISASIAATYSEVLSRLTHSPATTFVICAIIPLVPGVGMYKTMFAVVHSDVTGSIKNGLETIFTAGSVAVALFLVSIFSKLFWHWFAKFFK